MEKKCQAVLNEMIKDHVKALADKDKTISELETKLNQSLTNHEN